MVEHNLLAFTGYFQRAEWPHVTCPVCERGLLEIEEIRPLESAQAKRNQEHESWEPDWDEGIFYGVLKCTTSRCGEQVIVSGLFKTQFSRGGISKEYYGGEGYEPSYLLRYSIPVIPVIIPPLSTPMRVKDAINSASELIWIDPGAAGNRLRYAVEILLTDQKVARSSMQ